MQVLFKFAAMGILAEEGAFLRNGWNQVDFFVVVVGWLPYAFRVFAENGNLTGLRAIRALRPLRTLTHLVGMRKQVDTLIHSIPKLADVGLLITFIVSVFGVLGLQLFKGALHKRCYVPGAALPVNIDGVCGDGGVEGSQGTCSAGQVCLDYGVNPFNGTIGYDDVRAPQRRFDPVAAASNLCRSAHVLSLVLACRRHVSCCAVLPSRLLPLPPIGPPERWSV